MVNQAVMTEERQTHTWRTRSEEVMGQAYDVAKNRSGSFINILLTYEPPPKESRYPH